MAGQPRTGIEAVTKDGVTQSTLIRGFLIAEKIVEADRPLSSAYLAEALDLPKGSVAAELYLDAIPAPRNKERARVAYAPPALQAVTRDLAFIVPEDLSAAELERAVADGDEALQLFFVQRGDCDSFCPADDIDPDYGRQRADGQGGDHGK